MLLCSRNPHFRKCSFDARSESTTAALVIWSAAALGCGSGRRGERSMAHLAGLPSGAVCIVDKPAKSVENCTIVCSLQERVMPVSILTR